MTATGERAYFPQPFADVKSGVIASPFQFTLDGNDNLQVVASNTLVGARIAIQGRRITEEGTIEPFTFVHVPNSNRTVTTQVFKLGRGALLNLAVFVDVGTPLIGQTFVMLQIVRGFGGPLVLLGTLLQGYVTSSQGLGWPGSPIQSSIEGGGYYRVMVGTKPAAGAVITETVPTGARWVLTSIQVILTTSATAGNRRPFVQVSANGSAQAVCVSFTTVPASDAGAFYFTQGLPHETGLAGAAQVFGLPSGLTLLAGSQVIANAVGLQAGDQFEGPTLSIREWLEVI